MTTLLFALSPQETWPFASNVRFMPTPSGDRVHTAGDRTSKDSGRTSGVWPRQVFPRPNRRPLTGIRTPDRGDRLATTRSGERYDRRAEGDVDAVTRAANGATSADDALVRRARTGDAAAFEILVDGRIDRCYRLAYSILSNEADAADATQDALVSAWRQLSRLRVSGSFD